MRGRLQFLSLLALAAIYTGCTDARSSDEVAKYRDSLNLSTTPLSYKDAMKVIIDQDLQGVLERVAQNKEGETPSGTEEGGDAVDLSGSSVAVLDAAVRIDNLFRRADWVELKSRGIDPDGFDALVRRLVAQANKLALAAVTEDTDSAQTAADQLLLTCQTCHESYR